MHWTKKIEKELIFEIFVFVAGLIAITQFYETNTLLTMILILLWFIGIKAWHTRQDIFFFIAGAVIGTIAEVICVNFGVWQYANPTYLGVPIWIPFAWGIATMMITRTGRTLVKLEKKK